MKTRRAVLLGGVLVGACGPTTGPKKVEQKQAEPPKLEAKVEVPKKVEPPKVEPTEQAPESGPRLLAEAIRPGTAELDGGKVEVDSEAGWERRKVVGGGEANGSGGPGGGMAELEGVGSLDGRSGGGGGAKTAGAPPPAMAPAPADMARKEEAKPKGGPGRDPAPKEGPLKAGSTDDNADFKGYLQFLAGWTSRPEVAGQYQPLVVEGREYVRVLDSDGQPIPSALVHVRDAGDRRELWRARTYGDGRAPFYPKIWGAQVQTSGRYAVEVEAEGSTMTLEWDGASELVVRTPLARKQKPLGLDVLFLIDTTGSMGDEIQQVKSTLLAVTGKVKGLRQDLDLRYGAVLYKDTRDEYVTMAYPFTADVATFNTALQTVTAGGGGDFPESLNQGLERAVSGVEWKPEAAKLIFLIADAPPQMRLKGDVLYGDSAIQAVARGIRLHSVAASGLDELGTLVLRQLAQLTRGKFIFIEYGGTQATAASHGVTGPVSGGNNLDDIIAREITAEIEGWGRP